ncbi:4a-hydroxytetrahydrobiopterin dehydratase [Saccharopolyspora rhizosphaerae]|uniref:Putative pterin-4-alpha-carbinolamine dehydratase n=1 Tax=Saccharopolyspora rhizosphaerae TaxID=2492662 RepID=A0A426JQX9_9PSEU|nr:4a-hydroxytetrahydrobiopterin dehydratase [Saccharopolyspora rhizosphaerae]RRO15554.1 4a-hydroxytetrahydrobiopterin dehydratase [Saccharopolyspora rhizosphaerae]
MTELLTDAQISEALQHLPTWRHEGAALVREVEFAGFPQAVQAVTRVAEIAENENHHPDIDIRYTTVTFSLSTHFKGGITGNDTSMAQEIDDVVEQFD